MTIVAFVVKIFEKRYQDTFLSVSWLMANKKKRWVRVQLGFYWPRGTVCIKIQGSAVFRYKANTGLVNKH